MFVRKIKSNKGIIEVGRYGVDRIDVHDDGSATYYTAGGNIFDSELYLRQILQCSGVPLSYTNCMSIGLNLSKYMDVKEGFR